MTQLTFDFSNAQPVLHRADANDYHHVPASGKQLHFAHQIAARARKSVPQDALASRDALSAWIDANKAVMQRSDRFSSYPSSKQVAFAERIARIKRRSVPDECFKDRTLMSRWIDRNR